MNAADAAYAAIEASHREFKLSALRDLYPQLTGVALSRALMREVYRDGAYLSNARRRMHEGTARARSLAPSKRAAAIDGLIRTERRYLEQHMVAAQRRMSAEQDMAVLKESGEPGAYWVLGQRARHTADCLRLANRWWPWDVLTLVNPATRHEGCGCSLISVSEAERQGRPIRRGYRTASMRAAISATLPDPDDATGLRLLIGPGRMRPELEPDAQAMVAAFAAGDRTEAARLRDRMLTAARELPDRRQRHTARQQIARLYTELQRRRRPAVIREDASQPWTRRGTYAWVLDTDQAPTITRPDVTVRTANGQTLIETTSPDAARDLEDQQPRLREARATRPGDYLDDPTPLPERPRLRKVA
jgi:hypothetical protein